MARPFKCSSFGFISVLIVFGFLLNLFLLWQTEVNDPSCCRQCEMKSVQKLSTLNGEGLACAQPETLLQGSVSGCAQARKGSYRSSYAQPRLENIDEIIDSLTIPEYSGHKGLLLGKMTKKVPLAFGMLATINAMDKTTFAETARAIIRQDPKPRGSRSLVIVLLLTENRKSKIQKILDSIKRDLADSLSQGYVQLIISPFDEKPETFENLYQDREAHDVPKSAAKINLELSYLCHYSYLVANNLIILDNSVKPKPNALNEIYKQMNTMTPRTLEVDFNEKLSGRLYNGRFLPRLSSFLYAMAFVGTLDRMLFVYQYTAANETKVTLKNKELYDAPQNQYKNPPARVTTSMKSVYKDNHDYAYKAIGPSWFYSPVKSDVFTVKLDNPVLLKRIAIDVGLDSFQRDALFDAVVELSYETAADTKECVNYAVVRSFENSASVEISFDKEEDISVLQKPIHCIRIRVTEDFRVWAAIRMIIIEPI